jgi:hypothetical protein
MMPMMPTVRDVQEYHAAISRAAEIAARVGLPWKSFELDCEVAFDLATAEEAAQEVAERADPAGLQPVLPARRSA